MALLNVLYLIFRYQILSLSPPQKMVCKWTSTFNWSICGHEAQQFQSALKYLMAGRALLDSRAFSSFLVHIVSITTHVGGQRKRKKLLFFCSNKGSMGEESWIQRSFDPWKLGLTDVFKSHEFPSISQVSQLIFTCAVTVFHTVRGPASQAAGRIIFYDWKGTGLDSVFPSSEVFILRPLELK